MNQFIKYVGLDTHKDTIAVAIADITGGKPRYYGEIANTPAALTKLMKNVSPNGEVVSYCYEAGPCGYGIYPGRNPKDNPRFIVTNLKTSPKFIYEKIYCARGDVENRIKEPKVGLEIDRTSCTSFKANQLHEFQGQPVAGVDDSSGLRADAGTALARSSNGLRAGPGEYTETALVKVRCLD